MASHRAENRPGPDRRRRSRREALRRRIRRRRRVALAVGGSVLVLALLLGISLGGGGGEEPALVGGTGDAEASALARSKAARLEQSEALDRVLGYTEFLRQGRPGARRVALTFDDGPGPYTEEILRILRKHDAPATFFVLGLQLDDFAALTRKALRQGHAIGSHGFDHARMGLMPAGEQRDEIARTEAAMREHRIDVPRLFRPPFGSFDATTVELLAERDSLMVLWSVDTDDYLGAGADAIAERALAGAKPGAVILLHDAGGDRSQTVAALPRILAGLRKRNLQPVTVPQLLVDNPPRREQRLEQAQAVPPPGESAAP